MPAASERVALGKKHAHRLVEEVVEDDSRVGVAERIGSLALGDEGQLELAGTEHRHRLLGLGFEHGELDVWVARDELRDGGRHERRTSRRERSHSHPPAEYGR